jgi:hypothetical protein
VAVDFVKVDSVPLDEGKPFRFWEGNSMGGVEY